jgi:hypothetical protein
MSDVYFGEGSLDGRGIYAARSFDEGEVVVSFELRPLTREEYLALPDQERLFVHSYGSERWLYPPPARYVNHADTPNTWQDFDRQCNIALRHIEAGELITTDARKETDRELETFFRAYHAAINANDHHKLDTLIDDAAFGWVETLGRVDKAGIINAARQAASDARVDDRLPVRDPKWIIATGRWEAVCSYDTEVRLDSAGHVTDVLRVIDGNWQLIYRHESRP